MRLYVSKLWPSNLGWIYLGFFRIHCSWNNNGSQELGDFEISGLPELLSVLSILDNNNKCVKEYLQIKRQLLFLTFAAYKAKTLCEIANN